MQVQKICQSSLRSHQECDQNDNCRWTTIVVVVVVEFLNYKKKLQVTTRSKLGRNVRKVMYDPFPPYGDVRPSKSAKASLK